MIVRYELSISNRCPVDDTYDRYDMTVEAHQIVKVEDILVAVRAVPIPLFQEQITVWLATALECRVTTVGYHSGVLTTCTA